MWQIHPNGPLNERVSSGTCASVERKRKARNGRGAVELVKFGQILKFKFLTVIYQVLLSLITCLFIQNMHLKCITDRIVRNNMVSTLVH